MAKDTEKEACMVEEEVFFQQLVTNLNIQLNSDNATL